MLTVIIIVILLILIAAVIALTIWTQKTNDTVRASQSLLPFSGYLAPSGDFWTVGAGSLPVGVGTDPEDGLYLANTVGDAQIQCPSGTSVNIVGAFLDIVDPYGECPGSTDPSLLATCGIGTSSQTCTVTSDCPAGMSCNGKGLCSPMICSGKRNNCGSPGTVPTCDSSLGSTCSATSDCGKGMQCVRGVCTVDPGQGGCMACVDVKSGVPIDSDSHSSGVCAYMPVCSNTSNGENGTCSRTGDAACRPRDASAYLAKHCDGKQSCLDGKHDIWTPNTPGGPFGPLPCSISAKANDSSYASLPVAMGWGGGTPPQSSDGTPTPANFNQGYYVHGIYTCMPN